MFSNQETLNRRTPKDGIDRKQFINLLVDEFLNTNSLDAKHQVLANLANFAYDPINFEHLRQSGSLDIFLNQISPQKVSEDQELTQFACTGICNLCLDPESADYIVKYDGISNLVSLLLSNNSETVINAITTLIFLKDRVPKEAIDRPEILRQLIKYKEGSKDRRLKNLAAVFLEDVCGRGIVEKYRRDIASTPLPS